jgi:hypothetical protein
MINVDDIIQYLTQMNFLGMATAFKTVLTPQITGHNLKNKLG